jgi:hypothetical protein
MQVQRLCRGTRVCVTVRNPEGAQSGVREIRVDGKLLASPFLAWEDLKNRPAVQVEILLGENK